MLGVSQALGKLIGQADYNPGYTPLQGSFGGGQVRPQSLSFNNPQPTTGQPQLQQMYDQQQPNQIGVTLRNLHALAGFQNRQPEWRPSYNPADFNVSDAQIHQQLAKGVPIPTPKTGNQKKGNTAWALNPSSALHKLLGFF